MLLITPSPYLTGEGRGGGLFMRINLDVGDVVAVYVTVATCGEDADGLGVGVVADDVGGVVALVGVEVEGYCVA